MKLTGVVLCSYVSFITDCKSYATVTTKWQQRLQVLSIFAQSRLTTIHLTVTRGGGRRGYESGGGGNWIHYTGILCVQWQIRWGGGLASVKISYKNMWLHFPRPPQSCLAMSREAASDFIIIIYFIFFVHAAIYPTWFMFKSSHTSPNLPPFS